MRKSALIKIIISSIVILILSAWLITGMICKSLSFGLIDFSGFSFGSFTINGTITYNDSGYSIGDFESDDNAEKIDIDWIAGNISIVISDDGKYHVREEINSDNDNYRMRVKHTNGTLFVKPIKSGENSALVKSKNLTIEIPSSAALTNLNIRTGAGNIDFESLSISSLDLDMGAGNIKIENGIFKETEIDMGAGNVEFDGDFGKIEIDMGAGNLDITGKIDHIDVDAGATETKLVLKNTPKKVDIDLAGGNIDITLPSDCTGFDAEIDAAFGVIEVEGFEGCKKKKHSASYGDRAAEIDCDLATGTLTIRQASEE